MTGFALHCGRICWGAANGAESADQLSRPLAPVERFRRTLSKALPIFGSEAAQMGEPQLYCEFCDALFGFGAFQHVMDLVETRIP
jgi:hypothetical protein